jgi:neopullulanase
MNVLKIMEMKKMLLFLGIIGLTMHQINAQSPMIKRVDPTNWYVGMKNPNVQLLVYGTNIKGSKLAINYAGVTVQKVHEVENPNYLFVDLVIAPETKAGTFSIELSKTVAVEAPMKSKTKKPTTADQVLKITRPYELKTRTAKPQTIDSKDFVYLILPDRFSNGDPSNDKFADMADPASDRKNPFLRHGGDLQGVVNHLDYIKDLGATTIWLNPVIENNQPQTDEGGVMRSAYHGYGFTDQYNVDRRLGGNDAYRKMIDAAHAKGLKVMQDAVYNHVGINHWILKDMPMKDWLNQWDTYTNTSYHDEPVVDILHNNKSDFKVMQNGWFVPFLPDLNHANPFVEKWLIQHALWTVEYFNIDGWRVDTYQYNDLAFMNRCNAALLDEYPKMYITAENSVTSPISQAYYVKNTFNTPFKSNCPSPNDFTLYHELEVALIEPYSWGKGLHRLYAALANDLIYEDPSLNLTFLDNHDQNRFFSMVKEDLQKYKMGVGFLLTTRGVPQLYYGTEILMKNYKDPSDAEVRQDFPGGFAGDTKNKFNASDRTPQENEAFDFVKKLANYRKNSSALQTGKLVQYLPVQGVYVYFRQDAQKTVMVIMNQNTEEKAVETKRFTENMVGFTKGKNVLTDAALADIKSISVPAMSIQVIELMK